MTSRRLLKAAEAIRQVVGMAILAEMRDPRVRDVTITRVVVAPDMREAKVYVSIMGDTAKQNLCLHGLQSARGFLQSKLAERIETRYTPRLQFIIDMGVKHSLEVARILQEVLPPKPTAGDESATSALSGAGGEIREELDDDDLDDLDDWDDDLDIDDEDIDDEDTDEVDAEVQDTGESAHRDPAGDLPAESHPDEKSPGAESSHPEAKR